MGVILETNQLCKFYGTGENQVKAVNHVNIQIGQGEFVAIVGKSGSGKSTLLHMLGGLDTPTSGSVILSDKDLYSMKEDQLAVFRRRKIGFIFQNYNLAPMLNIYENIVFPLTLDGRKPDEELLRSIISFLRLEDLLDAFPGELSGGQQQRAAIARALIAKPPVVLADEPTAGLDPAAADSVLELFDRLHRSGHTLVLITHDERAAQCAARRMYLENGCIFG